MTTYRTAESQTAPQPAAPPPAPRTRRNPAPIVLGGLAGVLVIYYLIVALSGVLNTSTRVPITGTQPPATENYLTLQMRTDDVDLTNRVLQASVLPIPSGDLVGDRPGEMSKSLRIEIVSAEQTTSVVTFPGKSILDPTAVSLTLDRGDSAYPFDQPFANFNVSVTNDETGENVPFVVNIDNSARPWVMAATAAEPTAQGTRTVVPFTLDGNRDTLSIVLVMFYVLAILLTTLMAVVTIGIALLKKKLEFSNIIWLSATMLSFPALRSGMPGAPPIGTAMDYIVLFPCICLVAGMLDLVRRPPAVAGKLSAAPPPPRRRERQQRRRHRRRPHRRLNPPLASPPSPDRTTDHGRDPARREARRGVPWHLRTRLRRLRQRRLGRRVPH